MVEVFTRDKIQDIKYEPGCYIWFFNYARIRKSNFETKEARMKFLEAIYGIHQPNSLKIEATKLYNRMKQHFGEEYSGIIEINNNQYHNFFEIAENNESFYSFLEVIGTNPIPLYIGKSENLKNRIYQHNQFLEHIPPTSNSSATEEEYVLLKNFSERINKFMHDYKSFGISLNMLSVKILYLPTESITSFENSLNRLYKPILGIK